MQSFLILVLSLVSFGSFQEEHLPKEQIASEAEENSKKEGMTTYFFIRHAEKDLTDKGNKNPELSPEGRERTRKWIDVFRDTHFDLIYSSGYKRTDQTAAPIAKARHLEVTTYDASLLNDKAFQKETKGKNVLIVGHSNTNPRFVNEILEKKIYEDLPESEYGSLYVLHIAPDGTKSSSLLYFN